MAKYLDDAGLGTLVDCIKDKIAENGFSWNLLNDTKDFGGLTAVISAYERSVDEEGFTVLTVECTEVWRYIYALTDIDAADNPLEGQEIVLSADVKADNISALHRLEFGIFGSNDGFASVLRKYYKDYYFTAAYNAQDFVDGEWVRVKIRITAPAVSAMSEYSEYRYGMGFFHAYDDTAGDISIRKMKMEFGEEATPWQPSLADLTPPDVEAITEDEIDELMEE